MPVTTGLATVGFGSNTQLAYIVQTAKDAIDATPAWNVVPFTSAEMTVQAEQINDDSMTGDRSELEPRSGTINGQMTVSGKFRPECLDALIEAAMQSTWGLTTGATFTQTFPAGSNYVSVGSTQRNVAWELYHADTDEYVRMINTEISAFSVALATNGDITFSLTAIGGEELDLGAAIGTAVAGATYVETTKPMYDSFNGTLALDGVTGVYFSSMSPSVNNNSTPLLALGSRYPFAVAHGKMTGDLSVTAYYTDETVKVFYQDETALDLTIQVKYENAVDASADFHSFVYPACKITSFGRPVSGAGELMENMTLKPFTDTSIDASMAIVKSYNA